MQARHWMHPLMGLAVLGSLTLPVFGQEMAAPAAARPVMAGTAARMNRTGLRNGPNRFEDRLEKAVGLTPEQRDAVRGLLAQQREESQALREKTDSKIRTLLNVEQQKKFDEMLARQKAWRARPGA